MKSQVVVDSTGAISTATLLVDLSESAGVPAAVVTVPPVAVMLPSLRYLIITIPDAPSPPPCQVADPPPPLPVLATPSDAEVRVPDVPSPPPPSPP